MLSTAIKRISNEFLEEAKQSPNLFADMASMETYLAESYGERILIELLQNADDAASKNVSLLITDDTIFFANDGRPFSEEDIISICRSGASKKKRGEEIGFRGVGFKSTTALSTQIIIASNDAFFTFSKNKCSEILQTDLSKVPTVRIPFNLDKSDLEIDIVRKIDQLYSSGFTTVFIFKNSEISIIEQELRLFDANYLLFLRNIKTVNVDIENKKKYYSIKRESDNNGTIATLSSNDQLVQWWLPFLHGRHSTAFKINEKNEVIACGSGESVFHCYLPTLESCPYQLKMNGDFSTDPSRKHLIIDVNTRNTLKTISEDLLEIVQMIIKGEIAYTEILTFLTTRSSFSTISSTFADQFENALRQSVQILLHSQQITTINKYMLLDSEFLIEEKLFIRKYCMHFTSSSAVITDSKIEGFFDYFGTQFYSLNDYLYLLLEEGFVKKCSIKLFGKIFGYVIKRIRMSTIGRKDGFLIQDAFIKTTAEKVIMVSEITPQIKFSSEVIEAICSYISSGDWDWFCKTNKIKNDSLFINNVAKGIPPAKTREKKAAIAFVSRWRSAEQQCIDVEEALGNTAVYVGNRNLGYDIESKTKDGTMRYIEVKLIQPGSGNFTMTNNEYTSAHKYGKSYFIYAITQLDDGIRVTLINNPIESLSLEKRVKQWEWYCNSFTGENMDFLYE